MKRPEASSEAVSRRMSMLGRRDTGPELAIRTRLHAAGLRYRVDRRPIPSLRTRADLVFARSRVAVFVDGCFWHRCPDHFVTPKANQRWWEDKLEGNVVRDRAADRALREAGWLSIRIWEHEDPDDAAARVYRAVRDRG